MLVKLLRLMRRNFQKKIKFWWVVESPWVIKCVDIEIFYFHEALFRNRRTISIVLFEYVELGTTIIAIVGLVI